MSHNIFAVWYSKLNNWEFPSDLKSLKPDGFDDLDIEEKNKNKTFRSLYWLCVTLSTNKQRYRFNHVNNLGSSEAEFEDWYKNRFGGFFKRHLFGHEIKLSDEAIKVLQDIKDNPNVARDATGRRRDDSNN